MTHKSMSTVKSVHNQRYAVAVTDRLARLTIQGLYTSNPHTGHKVGHKYNG